MIRTTVFAIAAAVSIASTTTAAQSGDYGHDHSYSHGYTSFDEYKPSFQFINKCQIRKVGHRKVYNPYTHGFSFRPSFKRVCKRVRVYD